MEHSCNAEQYKHIKEDAAARALHPASLYAYARLARANGPANVSIVGLVGGIENQLTDSRYSFGPQQLAALRAGAICAVAECEVSLDSTASAQTLVA